MDSHWVFAYVSFLYEIRRDSRLRTLNLNHCEGSLYDILRNKIEKENINVLMVGALSAEYSMKLDLLWETAKKIDGSIIKCRRGWDHHKRSYRGNGSP